MEKALCLCRRRAGRRLIGIMVVGLQKSHKENVRRERGREGAEEMYGP